MKTRRVPKADSTFVLVFTAISLLFMATTVPASASPRTSPTADTIDDPEVKNEVIDYSLQLFDGFAKNSLLRNWKKKMEKRYSGPRNGFVGTAVSIFSNLLGNAKRVVPPAGMICLKLFN